MKQIFVNLPVRDLPRSAEFFTAVGFRFEPKFSDASAKCMVVGDNIFAMLLEQSYFRTFTSRPVADAHQATEVILCVTIDSRAAVDEIVRKAVAAGGRTPHEPKDHGFMYQHGFDDLDGHVWEFVWMAPEEAANR